jgi:hypothetical protein
VTFPRARRTGRNEPVPVRITTAPQNARDDIDRRRRRYVMSMTIRTLCFVGAVLTDGWLRWVLVAAAFLLPYVAVVMANSASPRIEGADLVQPHSGHKELGR